MTVSNEVTVLSDFVENKIANESIMNRRLNEIYYNLKKYTDNGIALLISLEKEYNAYLGDALKVASTSNLDAGLDTVKPKLRKDIQRLEGRAKRDEYAKFSFNTYKKMLCRIYNFKKMQDLTEAKFYSDWMITVLKFIQTSDATSVMVRAKELKADLDSGKLNEATKKLYKTIFEQLTNGERECTKTVYEISSGHYIKDYAGRTLPIVTFLYF